MCFGGSNGSYGNFLYSFKGGSLRSPPTVRTAGVAAVASSSGGHAN
jgi:hypothetical protein